MRQVSVRSTRLPPVPANPAIVARKLQSASTVRRCEILRGSSQARPREGRLRESRREMRRYSWVAGPGEGRWRRKGRRRGQQSLASALSAQRSALSVPSRGPLSFLLKILQCRTRMDAQKRMGRTPTDQQTISSGFDSTKTAFPVDSLVTTPFHCTL